MNTSTSNELTARDEWLLCNFEDKLDVPEDLHYIKQLWSGNWQALLVNSNNLLQNILSNNGEECLRNNEETFCVGIASLFAFIQSNYTGPELHINDDKDVRKFLSIDSEEVDTSALHLEYLYIAKWVFENCTLNNVNVVNWWYMRYTIIHQQLLDECSETLYKEVNRKIAHFDDWNIDARLKAKLNIELAQMYLLYGQVNESEKCLKAAQGLLCLDFELSGELGKRTKFQHKNMAQIILRVNCKSLEEPSIIEVPNIIILEDEVRLDKIQFCNEYDAPALPVTEQSLLLSIVQLMQRSRPKDELLMEESQAFLATILGQNNNWNIRFNALLLRCLLESKHKRTIERSLMQCESLLENLSNKNPEVVNRLGTFWGASMLPIWKIQAQMAELTLNLGLVKASLELYLKLEMWEEVIVCYTILELRHKAAEIIKTQLDVQPSVKLLCLLGDATDDVTCYEKAWILSGEKSSRAQKHWGQYFFSHKQYQKSIPHLEKSLEINSLQNVVWLRLGFAALETEEWNLAAKAYRRYTYLEPGGFEAWNNLAKAYVKLGEKTRAHFALQEALKFSFENWKIWDNFMVVSAAIKNVSDVIRSYHQILDIKSKHSDLEVLRVLTNTLLSENKNSRLLQKSLELFGRLTSIYPNDPHIWEMYSELSPTLELKAQRLSRAYRALVQDDWSKNPEKCGKVLEICTRLAETTLEAQHATHVAQKGAEDVAHVAENAVHVAQKGAADVPQNGAKNIPQNVAHAANSIALSTRMTLKAAISATKKQGWEQHEKEVNKLEVLFEQIVNLTNTV